MAGIFSLFFLVGVFLLISGIAGALSQKRETADYQTVTGYFVDYQLYSSGTDFGSRHGSPTYALTYRYTVGGQDYTVTTDYGDSNIPQPGSQREIRYDPADPSRAVIAGMNSHSLLIFVGALFVGIPLIFLLILLSGAGFFGKIQIDLIGFVIGLFFLAMGLGCFWMLGSSLSPVPMFQSIGLWGLIPFMFVLTGIFMLCKSLFLARKKFHEEG